MVLKKVFILALAVFPLSSFAQKMTQTPICGYKMVEERYKASIPDYELRVKRDFEESQSLLNSQAKTTAPLIRIPIVFHVVYNSSKPQFNLDQSVINKQLQILNDAYRHRHAQVGQTRPIFQPLAGDAEIEFYLATKDPSGNPTNGVTRTQTNRVSFGDLSILTGAMDSFENVKKTNSGGIDPWPVDEYLNVWIADFSFDYFGIQLFVLGGYATPPQNPLPSNWPIDPLNMIDGVVLQTHFISDNNPLSDSVPEDYDGFKSGKVMVHEVGHYLGLRHIFSDYNDCADADDGIQDTPEMLSGDPSNSCTEINTCGMGNSGDKPDMYENYMDYSSGSCQTMFTEGQIAHMRLIYNTRRSPLTIEQNDQIRSLYISPNPSQGMINIQLHEKIEHVNVYNMHGQVIFENNKIGKENFQEDLSFLPTGIYLIQVKTAESLYSSKWLKQ